jgi:hypothetical protein
LTDSGLSQFISDLLINPKKEYEPVKAAFEASYSAGKSTNMFTKSRINLDADAAIAKYFTQNIKSIEKWFNVIAPSETSLYQLKNDLQILSHKKFEEVY